jgi:hypothetical protein
MYWEMMKRTENNAALWALFIRVDDRSLAMNIRCDQCMCELQQQATRTRLRISKRPIGRLRVEEMDSFSRDSLLHFITVNQSINTNGANAF